MSGRETIADEAIVLQVKNWQDADKYAVCFSKEHGRLNLVAYGARYAKNVQGRLLRQFANLRVEVAPGQRLGRLKGCELLALPRNYDMRSLAYASVIAELTVLFTEEMQPQQELYELLKSAFDAVAARNPRLVALSFAVKLLALSGVSPQIDACVNCGKALEAGDAFTFSCSQGGILCPVCLTGEDTGQECGFNAALKALWVWLLTLDYERPKPFRVKGGDMLLLEKMLLSFIAYQTGRPLQSLNFLQQLGL